MAHLTDEELARAEDRGRELAELGPRAVAARFDRESGLVLVELANGCLYGFPARLVEDLAGAKADDLAAVAVDGAGFNLNFPGLDVDLFVPAVVAGLFGTRAFMSRTPRTETGRRRPSAKSEAGAGSAKGGRARKTAGA